MEQEQTLTDQGTAGEGSSPPDSAIPATSAPASEAVKSVTEGQEESQSVPYERFKEVSEKAKRADLYEEILMEHADKLVKDPETGRIRLVLKQVEEERTPEEDGELTKEELQILEELHPSLGGLLDKRLSSLERRIFKQLQAERAEHEQYLEDSAKWLSKAAEEFGEDEVTGKKSPLRLKAQEIIKKELTEVRDGVKYIPPRAQYDAFVRALVRLQREAKSKSEKDSEPIKKQGQFVSTGGKGPSSSKMSEEDFLKMSSEERKEHMRNEVLRKAGQT